MKVWLFKQTASDHVGHSDDKMYKLKKKINNNKQTTPNSQIYAREVNFQTLIPLSCFNRPQTQNQTGHFDQI